MTAGSDATWTWRPEGSPIGDAIAAPAAPDRGWAFQAIRWALLLNVIVATSNFHEDIVPPGLSSLQQYASIASWITIIVSAACLTPRLAWKPGTDTFAIIAFYGFAILSVLWSDLSFATVMKAAALTVTSVGAYFLATRFSVDDIADVVATGLLILALASLIFVVFVPATGIDHSWQHEGDWQGIYVSKQSLGISGGLLMFFASYRFLVRRGWLRYLVSLAAAAACVLGSGSRGGGALALVACFSLLAAGRSAGVAKSLAQAPFAMTLVAVLLIGYFYLTGNDALQLFGTSINFTERTFIWQYALSHFDDRALFGFGINGFWSIDDILLTYKRLHGWVLDNFHSGYLAVVMETGLVGFTLFTLTTFLFGMRIAALIDGRSAPRSKIVLLIGFMILTYLIDFTETIFMRSTNLHATLILVMLFSGSLPAIAESDVDPAAVPT